ESAAPVARLLEDVLEPQVRALSGVLKKGEPMRVALLRPDTTAGLSISDSLFTHLRFNGKTLLENGKSYQQFLSAEGPASEAKALSSLATGLVAFRPHVVVYVASTVKIAKDILQPVEEKWPKDEKFRPRYVSNGYLMGDELFA